MSTDDCRFSTTVNLTLIFSDQSINILIAKSSWLVNKRAMFQHTAIADANDASSIAYDQLYFTTTHDLNQICPPYSG